MLDLSGEGKIYFEQFYLLSQGKSVEEKSVNFERKIDKKVGKNNELEELERVLKSPSISVKEGQISIDEDIL